MQFFLATVGLSSFYVIVLRRQNADCCQNMNYTEKRKVASFMGERNESLGSSSLSTKLVD
jgi:hypothetical protein